MAIVRNNYVFKGHKSLLGSKFVTYGELELPVRYEIFSQSKNGFDWGHTGPAARQLGFSILCQLSNQDFAREHALKFTHDIVRELTRDWILSASDVLNWIKKNTPEIENKPANIAVAEVKKTTKRTKQKANIVKDICNELKITQKNLAQILEVPEGTVSSWAVKNEIPRLGKKAIEFYIQSQKNQHIIDGYKSFAKLLHAS
ncbi:XRE family transcriptional regulator [Candidatus Sulfurimonas marisnigri]|uniref:XRE family transcriptional regulator n=1 Tax=Candidatus Sulfurimonas marisnigri TaxID=2740405 RepID=A0A7S7RPF2_9BACT|nr:DUF6166 domain-containing protein [Candidatus Sulfurimonas marisnigri]QOY53549.1 XRE family transcriptional regulator [Candidatus Sulfurimonas marisnigri]